MTKEQFDSQRWYKGIRVRIIGNPDSYEVEGVDFRGYIRVEGIRSPMPYTNLMVVKDYESRA